MWLCQDLPNHFSVHEKRQEGSLPGIFGPEPWAVPSERGRAARDGEEAGPRSQEDRRIEPGNGVS